MKTLPISEAAVLDALPDAVLVTDEDLRYVHANPAALDLLGYTRDELLRLRVPDLLTASGRWTEDELDRIKAEGVWRGRIELRRKDGTVVLMDSMAKTIETDGRILLLSTNREAPGHGWSVEIPELQHIVTKILAETDRLEEVGAAIELIGTQLRWDVAELWVVREEALDLVAIWNTPDMALSEFVEQTRQRRFARGEGLPGAVWESGEPRWISEGFQDPNFLLGRDTSGAGGLNSAFAVPLRSGDEIVGVLAAIARGRREEEPELPLTLQPISGQLAQFIHRVLTQEELRQSRDQLAAILGGVGDGITVQTPDGRLLYANEGAARTIGFETVDELLGTPVTEFMHRFELLQDDGSPMPFERLPGRRALMGERGAKELVRFRVVATGEERWSLVTASPVLDGAGRVRFAINIFQDVTENRRREETERFLGEASKILGSSLEYEATLTAVAELAVSGRADWCVAYVIDDDDLRQLEVAHADPSLTPVVEELQRKYPMDERRSQAVSQVAKTGESLLIPDITDDMLQESAVDQEHLEALKGIGFQSAIAVPIRTPQQIHGVLVMVSSRKGRRFDAMDLAVAEELGRRAGVAIDHARIYRERSHVARTLQQSLLPPELPALPGFEIAARYLPAKQEVGGDFYDVFPLGDGAWGLTIGDVCGKGVEAASLTALARYTVRAAAIEHPTPSEALGVLNEALLQQDLDGKFCTLVVGRIDRTGDRVTLHTSSGGHPLPLLIRGSGGVEQVGSAGTLLGVLPDPEVVDASVDMEIGDAVVMFTDGVSDEFRLSGAQLEEVLRTCSGIPADDVAQRVERLALAGRDAPRDDVAMLILRRVS
jgi:PAS domain S-box-containing protein